MTDLSSDRRVGAEVTLGNSELIVDAMPIVAGSVFGEIAINRRFSLVLRVPFAHVRYSNFADPDTEIAATVLGNAGAGIKFLGASAPRRGTQMHYGLDAYVHAPTASDGVEDAFALATAGALTLPDSGRYAVDATTLRVRGSVRYEGKTAFFQGDLGVDHRLLDGDDYTALVIGLGAGIVLSPYFAVLTEVILQTDVFEDDRDLLPTLDIGMRYHSPTQMAGLRLHLPFADEYRDANAIGLAVEIGVRF